MGDDQGLDALYVEAECRAFRTWRSFASLLKPAIDQQTGGRIKVQLVARPGDAPGTTVVGKAGIFHAAHTRRGRK
ncbi:hypothetical protein D3C76_722480 [compost metagenome]